MFCKVRLFPQWGSKISHVSVNIQAKVSPELFNISLKRSQILLQELTGRAGRIVLASLPYRVFAQSMMN